MAMYTTTKTLVPALANSQAPVLYPAVSGAMTASFNSDPFLISHVALVSLQAIWSGTPTGTLQLQVSNDPTPLTQGGPAATSWTNYSGTSVSQSGTADSFVWNLNCPCIWVRVVYTFSSGTGQLTVYAHGKAPH